VDATSHWNDGFACSWRAHRQAAQELHELASFMRALLIFHRKNGHG
jgi:hypothetical protein